MAFNSYGTECLLGWYTKESASMVILVEVHVLVYVELRVCVCSVSMHVYV